MTAAVKFTEWLQACEKEGDALAEGAIAKAQRILAHEKVEIFAPSHLLGTTPELIAQCNGGQLSAGMFSFLGRCIKKATDEAITSQAPVTPRGATAGGDGQNWSQEQMLAHAVALSSVLGDKKQQSKTVCFLLGPHLKKICLENLPAACQPGHVAMDAAASMGVKLQNKLKAAGEANPSEPFVFVDMRDFEPSWCKIGEAVLPEDAVKEHEGSEKEAPARATLAPKKCQPVLRWSVAFDKWAVFAAARGHLSFAKCLAHKELCQKIAFRATKKGRTAALGVIYDELCRKAWAERAMLGASDAFDIEAVAGVLDDITLDEAEDRFDEDSKAAPNAKEWWKQGGTGSRNYGGGSYGSNSYGNSASKVTCFKCGKAGHKSTECWSNSRKRDAQGYTKQH